MIKMHMRKILFLQKNMSRVDRLRFWRCRSCARVSWRSSSRISQNWRRKWIFSSPRHCESHESLRKSRQLWSATVVKSRYVSFLRHQERVLHPSLLQLSPDFGCVKTSATTRFSFGFRAWRDFAVCFYGLRMFTHLVAIGIRSIRSNLRTWEKGRVPRLSCELCLQFVP